MSDYKDTLVDHIHDAIQDTSRIINDADCYDPNDVSLAHIARLLADTVLVLARQSSI